MGLSMCDPILCPQLSFLVNHCGKVTTKINSIVLVHGLFGNPKDTWTFNAPNDITELPRHGS
jgi:hypothetical protein